MRGRRLAFGLLAVGGYLALAALSMRSFGWGVRPLFDGFITSQPYNWVSPPPEFASRNKGPESGAAMVALDANGSLPAQATTGDAQARLVMPAGVFAPSPADTGVRVTIAPLDPASVAPPPEGLAFQGNAYRFEATYQPSGRPAALVREANIVLRYPASATGLVRFAGSRWANLPAQNIAASLQLLANTREPGTFVAVGPSLHGRSRTFLLIAVTGGAAVVALALGLYLRSRAAQRKRTTKSRAVRRAAGERPSRPRSATGPRSPARRKGKSGRRPPPRRR